MPILIFVCSALAFSENYTRRPQYSGSRVHYLADALGNLHHIDDVLTDIEDDGTRHQLNVRSETVGKGQNAIIHYYLEHIIESPTENSVKERTQLAHWTSHNKYPYYEPLAIRVIGRGNYIALANHYWLDERGIHQKEIVLIKNGTQDTFVRDDTWSEASLLSDDNGNPIAFGRDSTAIEFSKGGLVSSVIEDTLYDWSVSRDLRGQLYVIAYDYKKDCLVVAIANEMELRWEKIQIDTPESGWQHSISMYKNNLYILYYYFRNTFNKGLKLAVLKNGKLITNQIFIREFEHNLGWEPAIGINANGGVVVEYLENVEEKELVRREFVSTRDLLAQKIPEYKGKWDDFHKKLFAFVGDDLGYQWWEIYVPTPSEEDAQERYKAHYDFNPAISTTLSFEGKYGDTNFGISYIKSLMSSYVKKIWGEEAGKGFDLLVGFLGFEKLFLGHDVRISIGESWYDGIYSDDKTAENHVSSQFKTVEIKLLNKYRIGYGLQYRNYELIQPIYAYLSEPYETSYHFLGSEVVNANIHRVEAFVEYSKLDYISKYENKYNNINLDIKIGLGAGILSWPKVSLGERSSNGTVEIAFSSAFKFNYLYYKRFYALRGSGFFFRVGYELSFLTNGFYNDKPEDRKSGEKDESFIVSAVHYQLFHGPFVGAGLVY